MQMLINTFLMVVIITFIIGWVLLCLGKVEGNVMVVTVAVMAFDFVVMVGVLIDL